MASNAPKVRCSIDLSVGGNHGDEYEGPIAFMKLARFLVADEIAGDFPALIAVEM